MEVRKKIRPAQQDADGTQSDGNAELLRRGNQRLVRPETAFRAAGHAGDEKRKRDFPTKEHYRGVELLIRDLGQRVVDESHPVETGPPALNPISRRIGAYFQVLLFARLGLRSRGLS